MIYVVQIGMDASSNPEVEPRNRLVSIHVSRSTFSRFHTFHVSPSTFHVSTFHVSTFHVFTFHVFTFHVSPSICNPDAFARIRSGSIPVRLRINASRFRIVPREQRHRRAILAMLKPCTQ